MTRELSEILDLAVEEMAGGKAVEALVADLPAGAADLEPLLETAAVLEELAQVPQLDQEKLATDRQAFLLEADQLRAAYLQNQAAVAISVTPLARLKEWITNSLAWPAQFWPGKEKRPMGALAFKFAMILVVAFGSMGGTAAVAANSLPDSPVYPVKMAMERARLALTQDPAAEAELHLAFAGERVQEIERMAERGNVPGRQVVTQIQDHMGSALDLAAQLPDEEMDALLRRTRQMIQAEQHGLTEFKLRVTERARERLQQASDALGRVDEEVEAGLTNPELFRWRHTNNRPEDAPPQPEMTPGPPESTPAGGNQNQIGPPIEQPGPGSPGGNPNCPNCNDADGQGQQQQEQEQEQQQNGSPPTDPPVPGGSGQPQGNSNCGDCEPGEGQNQEQGGQQPGNGQTGDGQNGQGGSGGH